MKQTEEFLELIADAQKWIADKSPDYDKGVDILIRSGFKKNLANRLKRLGNQEWTMQSLSYSLNTLVSLYMPVDANADISSKASESINNNIVSKIKKIFKKIKDDIKRRLF